MDTVRETARLALRRFSVADAEALLALDSDPEVMRHIGPYRLADADAYRGQIRTRFLPYYARYEGYSFLGGAGAGEWGLAGLVPPAAGA